MTTEQDSPRRRALIVGGSGGIGRAISRRLVCLNTDVIVTGAHQEKLDSLIRESTVDCRGRIEGIRVMAEAPEELLAALPAETEPDILVCSFGPVLYKPVGETSFEEWSHIAGMNLVLPGALITRFLPGMRRRGFGRILLFGVEGSETVKGYRQIGAYGAAKTALTVVVLSLADELAGTNVAVSALLPGHVETEYLSEEEKQRFFRENASQELKKPDEIAETACYLITAEDERHNGVILRLGEDNTGKNGDVVPLFDN